MKVLVAHNRYQQRGGEDVVVEQEIDLLRGQGCELESFLIDNDAITTPLAKLKTAAQVSYSWEMRSRMDTLLRQFKPDVLHVHNTFPRLSPAIYDAAIALGCPVVQTVHNFRLVCLNGTLFRDGEICLDCVDRAVPWPGVAHGCYRGSVVGSASVALMLTSNRMRGAWSRRVNRFVMLTPFARDFFSAHTALPAARMRVKPNAAPDRGVGDGGGGYAFFAGRLTPEKGIDVLLRAAASGLGMPLKVAGQGPLEDKVRAAHAAGTLEYLGAQSGPQIAQRMKDAAVLILPSLWYEGLPVVVPEAYSTGLPILASRIGSLASLVEHERTGLLFEPGDTLGLAAACRRLASETTLLASMRTAARAEYMRRYQPEANVKLLLSIYDELLQPVGSAR